MKRDEWDQICRRVRAVRNMNLARAYTYGPPVVMVHCRTKDEAEALAEFLNHAPADIRALLAEVGVDVEPQQQAMDLAS